MVLLVNQFYHVEEVYVAICLRTLRNRTIPLHLADNEQSGNGFGYSCLLLISLGR